MDPEGILNRLPVVIYLLDSDSGEVSYLSEGIARFLGHVPDLSTATAEWRSHIHPDDAAITAILDSRTRATGRPFEAEYRMVMPDGETVWVRDEATLVLGDGSRGAFWQGMVTDVTRRKEVEEDSWRSAARFRAIIEELPAIVYMNSLDIPPMTTYISPRLEAILGVKPEEWVENRRLWEDLAHPDDLERMLAEDVADYPDGRYQSEFRMMSRDGREVWFHDEAVLVRDEEGNPAHWEGVLVDISDQKAAEAREREAEERYRSLVERVPAVLYTDASQGDETLYVSPQIEAILGVLAGEYMEDHDLWAKMLHPDDRERVLAQYEEFRRGACGDLDDYRMVRPDGRVVWIRDRARIERDPAGRVVVEQGMMFDVTEQKEAEEREREAETRFKTLVETLPAIAYISTVGQPEKLIYVSPRIEELLGKSIEEWQRDPDPWNSMIHPDDRARVDALDQEANTTGRFSAEYRLASASETPVWVRDEGVLVHDEDGNPLYWEGLLSDITELKKTEGELERARESWKDLVDRTPTPIYIEEMDGTTRYVSPRLEELLGYSPEEWMSRPGAWRDMLHPDDRERIAVEELRVDGSLETFNVDYRVFHKDGQVVWLHDEAVVVRDANDEPLYWLGVHVDITARKEAEERLREAEERFRIFVEKGAGVAFIDGAADPWDTIYVSPQVFDVFGWTQEEYLREQDLWDKALHPDDRERVLLEDHETDESGEPLLTEYRMVNARGETLWIQERANMVRDADGVPLYWLGAFLDITEKKKAEAEIRRADARYRNLIDHIPVATYSQPYDTDSDIFMSPQIERITGWPVSTFENAESWTSVVHPDDGVPWTSEWADLADAAHEPLDARYRILRPDGSVVWVHDTALLVDATDDAPAMWQGVIEDITELKETETELERAREAWKELVDRAPAPIYIEEPFSGVNTYMSPLIEGLMGYPPEDWTSTPSFFEGLLHPDDREWVIAADNLASETLEPYNIEYRAIHKDGHVVWLHDEAVLVRGEQGEPLYWIGVHLDITERKEAEAEIRQADARYRNLIENIPVATYSQHYGSLGGYFMSPQIEGITGWPVSTFESAAEWDAVVHPEDDHWTSEESARTEATREPFDAQYRVVKPDGTVVWVHDTAVFIEATEDTPAMWQGVIQDITELKHTETELERARASWQDLVDQTPTPIYIEEPEGSEMRYISPLIEGLLGYPPEEFTARPGFIREVMHPDDEERFVEADLKATVDQGYYTSDYRVFHKEGHIVWLHDESVLVRDANGEPMYWLGVVSDVTAQKEAEELLRAAEERYRSLIEQIPAILTVYPIGVDAAAVYVSPYSETLLGYPSEDWYGAGDFWVERLHPDDKARVLHLYERSLEAQVDYSMEYRMMHKEGHAVWVEERGSFLSDENGDPMLVQSLIFDITERKLAEQMTAELAAQTHELDHLRELDDMKSAFMSAVSHELRTPLTAMLGGALTLQSAGQSLPQKGYEDILNMIVQGGHKMGKLLTDLLDIERLSKGATRLQSRKGDIGEVVRSVIQECRVLEGHPLELDLPSVWMRLDNVKVERVVDNLLTNADRHTPDGTPIHVSVKPHEDGALIIVEDEGPGVPDDLKTVIFEAFRQGSAPAESPGIGVGLALVAKLSELHGGRAWVEDREGGGASFHVVLASLPEDT